jgi:pSer/pThr/pTyr-binding forkhead associated (FHA) protein
MRTFLTIGREPDNDLVINLPIVSGHHARLTWEGKPGQAVLEDLGSSNGTSIGQLDRKITKATITVSDTVYFGNHPIPGSDLLAWVDPSLAAPLVIQGAEMVVGRDPSCQRVIDRATVSGRHARLRRSGDRIFIEDLGSSNGTFVNGRRVEGATEVRAGDLIGFGVDSFRLATGPAPVAGTVRMESLRPTPSHRPAPTLHMGIEPAVPPSAPWVYPAALAALLLQATVLAIAIVVVSGEVATALFTLSLAALWFGLSTAVFGLLLDPSRPEGGPSPDQAGFWLSRSALLGALGVGECLLAQLIVFAMKGLSAPTLPALGLLVLASGVGLAVGFLIVLLAPRPPIAWASLAVALVALGLFGGGPWSLPRSASVVRMASNAAPSRWAFEGLLVSESDARPSTEPAEGSKDSPPRDLAEAYFPAETDRMGARADALALASMLIGLLGVGVFLVSFSGARR